MPAVPARRRLPLAAGLVAIALAVTSLGACSSDGSDGQPAGPTSTTTAPSTTDAPRSTTTAAPPLLAGLDPADYLLPAEGYGPGWTEDPGSDGTDSSAPCLEADGDVVELDTASRYLTGPDGSITAVQDLSFYASVQDATDTLDGLAADLGTCDGAIEVEGQPSDLVPEPFDAPAIGDDRLAYRFDLTVAGQTYLGYRIIYRQGPLVSAVTLLGFPQTLDQATVEAVATAAAAASEPAAAGG